MKKLFVLLAVLPLLLVSCEESMKSLGDRVFKVAGEQIQVMDARLAPGVTPRAFDDGQAIDADLSWWCAGFFPGEAWFTYEYTGDEKYKEIAERRTHELAELFASQGTHDVGFPLISSFGNAFAITQDSTYLPMMREGAARLAKRFSPIVGATCSWGGYRDSKFDVIIDNMMNIELLTKMYHAFGTDSLMTIAKTHAFTTMRNHFRPDYTCYHLLGYDDQDGHVMFKCTVQGYADESAWARGQAWALYGYTMMAREAGEPKFQEQAEYVAQMLLGKLPEDGIPAWDFDAPAEIALKDASAAAVMASGFTELSTLTKDAELSKACRKMAETQVRTLAGDEYLCKPGEDGGFLLKHSVGHYAVDKEVDASVPYADYYFLEAVMRLNGFPIR